jgi:hypothetical protein
MINDVSVFQIQQSQGKRIEAIVETIPLPQFFFSVRRVKK